MSSLSKVKLRSSTGLSWRLSQKKICYCFIYEVVFKSVHVCLLLFLAIKTNQNVAKYALTAKTSLLLLPYHIGTFSLIYKIRKNNHLDIYDPNSSNVLNYVFENKSVNKELPTDKIQHHVCLCFLSCIYTSWFNWVSQPGDTT